MSEPVIAQASPYSLQLEPGKYWWCSCGRSTKQPFCDGSHQGSSFTPVGFDVAETKEVWLCGCKHAKTQPFCDGTHNKL
jgi:CDGSH-type Zn-finger protein